MHISIFCACRKISSAILINMKKVAILLLTLLSAVLHSQDGVFFSFNPDEKYRVIERSDYRIRVNGVYKGHIYNENRGVLKASLQSDGSYAVSGKYYVFEELTRDGSRSARKVNEINSAAFTLFSSGQMLISRKESYPLLRSFPAYIDEPMKKGDSWLAFSEKVVLRRDTVTVFPVYCEYVYESTGVYNGESVHNIRAKYAVRYNQGDDYEGDDTLKNISGTHDVTIIISAETGEPVLIRDNMSELHTYTNGGSLEKRGFILTFFKGVSGLNRAQMAQSFEDQMKEELGEEILNDVDVEGSEEGLKLTLKNLHFVPDQAVLLREDVPLLDVIADYLKKVTDRTFLIKGHTADVGTQESQFELSIERAQSIVKELVKRGIAEDRFLYMGMGGTEPLSSNTTDEGRAENRRVEIIILED